MTVRVREQLYALILAVVAILGTVGWLTDVQGAIVAATAIETITLAVAAWYAYRGGAPVTRQIIYPVLAAAAGVLTVWGIVQPELAELGVGVIMGVVGLVVAESNTNAPVIIPGEIIEDGATG